MSIPQIDDALREAIISRADVILDDQDLMQALITANDRMMGGNIVDLRGVAMDRLENRLGQLEDTHRSVIAAAYENMAGTNQIHRAILRLLDPLEFTGFLKVLEEDVAEILRLDRVRLVLETGTGEADPALSQLSDVMAVAPGGYVASYMAPGRGGIKRQIALRQMDGGDTGLYGDLAPRIRSEACLKLDLGAGRLPGLLVLGSVDPEMFSPGQGTDLLEFLAAVFERCMRRWLA